MARYRPLYPFALGLYLTYFSHTRLQLLDTWLARSRECPLSITITDYRRAPSVSVIRQYIDAILPHQRRWPTLVLKIPLADFPQNCFCFPQKLNEITLSGITRTIIPDKFRGSPADVVHILRSAVNLSCLTAQMTRSNGSERIISAIQHHHLRSLSLLSSSTCAAAASGSPHPTFIEVSGSILPIVTDLIARSQCPLDGLTVIVRETEYFAYSPSEGKVVLEAYEDEEDTDGFSG
ncbi:hypothetical protein B0H11DRAFT_2357074 [Mycena galericulata]|nr:hypothetical protein B0H11DRAFT_2357074 [Mycena galericulata]